VVLQSIVYAAILVLIMLFLPRGLLPGLIQFARRLLARLQGTHTADEGQNQAPIGELADG
jgi:hypothetical protein